MSSKFNVSEILQEHFASLKDHTTQRASIADLLSFYGLPILIAASVLYFGFNLSEELAALLVNFGSILTALLLSVLVMVYDQEYKLNDREENQCAERKVANSERFRLWRKTLKEAYSNICYAIVVAILLVLVCFLHGAAGEWKVTLDIPKLGGFCLYPAKIVFTPLAILFASNLILTVLMIVKRFHKLLTSEHP